ncbi:MAG: glycosyltransferase [Acidobacteriota bacterium]
MAASARSDDGATPLLFLAPAPPSPTGGGGALRMFQMLRFLGERFDVDLMAPVAPGAEETKQLLGRYCRSIELVPSSAVLAWRRLARWSPYVKDPAFARAVHRRLAATQYGAVQLEKAAMIPYLPAGCREPLILDIWAYGLSGPMRALKEERGLRRRARNLLRLTRFAAFDRLRWPDTYRLLVVSEIDRQRCLRARPGRDVMVVPNGVDCQQFRPAPLVDGRPPVLIFTGDMGFDPNVAAARLLAGEIFPAVREQVPEALLYLVGRNPGAEIRSLQGAAITVTGEVPEMTPYLQQASVYVAPLHTGAGTRTKLLEAMAAGLAIVTTRIGIEGIEAGDRREVVIADDNRQFVAEILRLISNQQERRRLGGAARGLAERRYDWSQCLAPLAELYETLLVKSS